MFCAGGGLSGEGPLFGQVSTQSADLSLLLSIDQQSAMVEGSILFGMVLGELGHCCLLGINLEVRRTSSKLIHWSEVHTCIQVDQTLAAST